MPFYEYLCSLCSTKFEELVGMSDPSPTCPGCGAGEVKRVPSTFAVGRSQPKAPSPPPGCGGCAEAGSCPMSG